MNLDMLTYYISQCFWILITNLRSTSNIVAFGTSFDLPSSITRLRWLLMLGFVLPPPSVDKQQCQYAQVAQNRIQTPGYITDWIGLSRV